MLRVNAINRQELLKCLTFNPKSLVIKTVSVPATRDGKIWLNQQQMAELFATSKQLISHNIANILKDRELNEISVVKQYLTTAADGKEYKTPIPCASSKRRRGYFLR